MLSTWTGMLLTCSLLFVVHGDDCAGKACYSEDASVLLQSTIQDRKVGSGGASPCSSATSGVFEANAPGESQGMPCSLCQHDFAARTNGGTNCNVIYDVPAACAGNAGKTCPLMFYLHGSTASNSVNQQAPSRVGPAIHATTRTTNFIGVYPMGSLKDDGMYGWNTGASQIGEGVDDAGFIKGILDKFHSHFGWVGRAYAFGESNGAAMCQRIAVNGQLGFTGVAPVASQLLAQPSATSLTPVQSGPGPYNYNWPSDAACTKPIAYLSIHGSEDPTIPYEGGVISNMGIELATVEATNEVWRKKNGCQGRTEDEVLAEAVVGTTTATHYVWKRCLPYAPTQHYKVIDGGHEAAISIDGEDLPTQAIDFFDEVEIACKRAGMNRCPNVLMAQNTRCN